MSRTGKQYTQEQAAAYASLQLQILINNQSVSDQNNNFFIGHISSDRTTCSDPQGNTYSLTYSGNPKEYEVCQKTSLNTAVCVVSNVNTFSLSGGGQALVLAYDNNGFYLRNLGTNTAYYLPTTTQFQGIYGDSGSFNPSQSGGGSGGALQALISSDGNAVLIGGVVQNQHTLTNGSTGIFDTSISNYHQFATYYVISDITFGTVSQTTTLQNQGYLVDLTYPTGMSNIVFCKTFQTNNLNLNLLANNTVPAPLTGANGSQGLWFPKATIQSKYTQYNPITGFSWDADSGYQNNIWSSSGISCSYTFSAQKTTLGNQNATYTASPNFAVFESFKYVFNNSVNTAGQTQYNADILTTFINGYLFTCTNNNWTESFYYKYDRLTLSGGSCNCGGETEGATYSYSEVLNFDYKYLYNPDFIYKLEYLATPDIWVTSTNVTVQTLNPEWLKTQTADSYQDPPGGLCPDSPYDIIGSPSTWDAWCFEQSVTDCYVDVGTSFAASQWAYVTSISNGPPFVDPITNNALPLYADGGYGLGGLATVNLYNGTQKKGNFDGNGGSWPGYYLAYYTGPLQYNWMDLNYDNLFFGTSSIYYAIYGGRSSMVINNLNNPYNVGNNGALPQVSLYGITTQLLGDGTDYNFITSAFRGRTYDPTNTNNQTAFIYKQNYNNLYFYSAPWLQVGNLGNTFIQQQNNSPLSTQDAISSAIGNLINYSSLMDAYGNTTAETNINNLITSFQHGLANTSQLPTVTQINNVTTEIIATDSSLTSGANALQAQLLEVLTAANANNISSYQVNAIGPLPPDIATDTIFSSYGTFPFVPYGTDSHGNTIVFNRYLKPIDSWLAQEYYVDTINNLEVIQGFNIADGSNPQYTAGYTTLGKKVAKTHNPPPNEVIMDYIIPITVTSSVT